MARIPYDDPEAEKSYQDMVIRSSEVSAKIPNSGEPTQKGSNFDVAVDAANYDYGPKGPENRTWERKNLKKNGR